MSNSNISEIKEVIVHLSDEEFGSFTSWLHKLEEERWDKELEKDITEGRLENLGKEALNEFNSGNCTEL